MIDEIVPSEFSNSAWDCFIFAKDIAYKNTVEQEKILLNAPEKVGEYFTVPKVIE